jgi:hypothetical protein
VLTFSIISWIVLSFVLLLFCCYCELVPVALAAGSCCEVMDACYGIFVPLPVIAEELIDVLIFY